MIEDEVMARTFIAAGVAASGMHPDALTIAKEAHKIFKMISVPYDDLMKELEDMKRKK